MFSILIPTWNNLPYLKNCIQSIQENSRFENQIIVHINEGKDNTETWLKSKNILFTKSKKNVGICKAMNQAFTKANHSNILYLNDDMYVLPAWDFELKKAIDLANTKAFMISGTMIEPKNTGNSAVIHADYGQNLDDFQKEKLLNQFKELPKKDWNGSAWPPVVIHKSYWEKIGGFSETFSPGMYSDPDFAMKMWDAGCRHFQGVASSRVYHFQAKSTGKVTKNNGRIQFMEKWGISANAFYKHYLKMGTPFRGPLSRDVPNILIQAQQLKTKFTLYFKS